LEDNSATYYVVILLNTIDVVVVVFVIRVASISSFISKEGEVIRNISESVTT
jgi:hypothetical protein